MSQNIRNIAILAHADAGKTTLTEQFLFLCGQTRQPGNVDDGTTQMDVLAVERERGISVRSSLISFPWKQTQINLIDTPGHVDFSSDVERTLRACDGAILIISAVEGLQAHTITLWYALKKRGIPVLLFMNKIDRMGADTESVCTAIYKEMKINPLYLQEIKGEGSGEIKILSLWSEEFMTDKLVEVIVSSDESLLDNYLEGTTPSFSILDLQLRHLIQSGIIYPLFYGSAKLGLGVKEVLDAVTAYLPVPGGNPEDDLSALVFGVGHDKNRGKIAHVRIFNGRISTRDLIYNASREVEEKVTQVRLIFPGKYEDTDKVEAGDIAGLSGLDCARVGDLLGTPSSVIPEVVKMNSPLIIVQVKAINPKDYPALAAALLELDAEDPSMEFEWLKEESELQLKIMGWIQMEVMERIIADRFGIEAKFENPIVIYKETPSSIAEGFVQYWMPKPCWAIMRFRIEPGKRGSGVSYQSLVQVNDLQQKYQNEVERSIAIALKQGIKGWEVTDIKITLLEGEDHVLHSRPGDFSVATPMGIMNGLKNSGSTLLEPIISFRIQAVEELLGKVTSDITRMRGSFESPLMEEGRFTLQGTFPLATSMDYPVKLSSRSGGKARILTRFYGYSECTDEQGVIRLYQGISPLDTAKYILKARKALK